MLFRLSTALGLIVLLFTCTTEKMTLTDQGSLGEEFVSPPIPMRAAGSTIMNPNNLSILNSGDKTYANNAREAALYGREDRQATARRLVEIMQAAYDDTSISAAEKANQIHLIGFMNYRKIIKELTGQPGTDQIAANTVRLMMATEPMDFGAVSKLLFIGNEYLTAEEKTIYWSYVRKGTEKVLMNPLREDAGNYERILHASALEAKTVLAAINTK